MALNRFELCRVPDRCEEGLRVPRRLISHPYNRAVKTRDRLLPGAAAVPVHHDPQLLLHTASPTITRPMDEGSHGSQTAKP